MQHTRTRVLNRILPMLIILGFGFAVCGVATAADPRFLDEPLYPSNRTVIDSIVTGPDADIVVLGAGILEGFIPGQICEVVRGESEDRVAELIISDSFLSFSVGLITDLGEGVTLEQGDRVRARAR